MNETWQRISSIVRKTGDRCIIFDAQTDEALVVMDLDQYEALLGEDLDTAKPATPSPLTQKTNEANIEPISVPLPPEPEEELIAEEPASFAEPSEESAVSSHQFYLEPIE
jgi:hypothetical protein